MTSLSRRCLVAVAAIVCLMGLPLTPATADTAGSSTAAWAQEGPLPVAVKTELVTTFYYPAITRPGATYPVVLWGNGTGGIPAVYDALLKHWASYGFIVAAANTPFSYTGLEMLAGLNELTSANGNPRSAFFGKVDLSRVIAAGHSQGGAGAINAGSDPRVTSVLALQPGPLADVRRLHSPLLLLTGSTDLIVPPGLWVRPIFFPLAPGPTVYACLRGAGHFASVFTPDGGVWRSVTTAWLLDAAGRDRRTREVFHSPTFALGGDSAFTDVERNRAAQSW